ncbi:BamA/TamA family outer membrane protein, partial [bacterium]|nr:BamA/TamA family outer membrane protein [bacterium]
LIQNPLDDWGLKFDLREGKANFFNGLVGYIPGVGSEEGQLTGTAELIMHNLWGTMRGIQLKWLARGEQGSEMMVQYREPWLLGGPLSLEFTFSQYKQDSTYTQQDWEISSCFPLTFFSDLNMGLSYQEITPDSIGIYVYRIPRSRSWMLNCGYNLDLFDRPFNPRTGGNLDIDLYLLNRSRGGPDILFTGNLERNLLQFKVETTARQAIGLFPSQVLYARGTWKSYLVKGDEIPPSDRYRLGGTTTLRGYKDQQFMGSKIAYGSLEYRLHFGEHSRVFGFLDGAWFESSRGYYKWGYGIGIRIRSDVGIVGVDYGLGEGRSVTSGIIHFSWEAQW